VRVPVRVSVNLRWLVSWAGGSLVLCLAGCSKSEELPDPAPAPPAAIAPAAPAAPAPPAPPANDCALKATRIREDTTLYKRCSPYSLRGGIDVLDNATLTIEPGVEVRFHDKDWLEIAAAGTRGGRLIARGTPGEHIVLTSVHPETTAGGTWFGLWFNAGTRGSVLSNVTIRTAGGDNAHIKPTLVQGCLTMTDVADGEVTIENVLIENCVGAGVVLKNSRPKLAGVNIKDSPIGVQLDGVARRAVARGITYRNVARKIVEAPASRPATPPP
jgi:hypothetical protein